MDYNSDFSSIFETYNQPIPWILALRLNDLVISVFLAISLALFISSKEKIYRNLVLISIPIIIILAFIMTVIPMNNPMNLNVPLFFKQFYETAAIQKFGYALEITLPTIVESLIITFILIYITKHNKRNGKQNNSSS